MTLHLEGPGDSSAPHAQVTLMSIQQKSPRELAWQTRLGRRLFALRSFTPLPLLGAAVAYLLATSRSPETNPQSPWVGDLEPILGWLLLLAGCALRARVVGWAPIGTSGRGRRLEAKCLVTWGPYAHMRNPLYFANFLICTGFVFSIGSWWFGAAVLALFTAQYAPVIRAEEVFLEATFGTEFQSWAQRTPRFWPQTATSKDARTSNDSRPEVRCLERWRRGISRDADSWFASLGGWLLWYLWTSDPAKGPFSVALPLFGGLLGIYLTIKLSRKCKRWADAVR